MKTNRRAVSPLTADTARRVNVASRREESMDILIRVDGVELTDTAGNVCLV